MAYSEAHPPVLVLLSTQTRLLRTTPFPLAGSQPTRTMRRLLAAVGVIRGGPAPSFLPPLLQLLRQKLGPHRSSS